MAEQKIPHKVGFTARQSSWIRSEAHRLDISENEVVRRVMDDRIDRDERNVAIAIPQPAMLRRAG